MSFQPLFQTDEAGKTILDFVKKELLPVITELETLAVDIADHRVDFLGSFLRKDLNRLQSRYQETNKKFLTFYHKYNTPDELFSEFNLNHAKDREKMGAMMGDYFNSRGGVVPHFEAGFRLLDQIDRQLTRYYQSADQRVAMTLAIVAITISIISVLFQIMPKQ